MTPAQFDARESRFADAADSGVYVYWCPICKVGTGDRAWHSLHDGGLFPQTATEHECVKIDVAKLIQALMRLSSHLSVAGGIDLMCSRSPVELRRELDARGRYAAEALT